MRVSEKHGFCFVSTPKNCTITFYDVLEKFYGAIRAGSGFHCNQVPEKYKGLFRWTVCRNPYERAVSLWWSAVRLHKSDGYGFVKGCGANDDFVRFMEWLADTKPRFDLMFNQSDWQRPAEPFDAVLRMEDIENEVFGLPFWLPPVPVLPVLNTTSEKQDAHKIEKRPSWRTFYEDKRAVAAVQQWAGEDFERFGYSRSLEW